jgi:hypothetical protein
MKSRIQKSVSILSATLALALPLHAANFADDFESGLSQWTPAFGDESRHACFVLLSRLLPLLCAPPKIAMEYKDTLNLPRTDFAMKADLVTREPERLKKWEAANLYAQIQAARASAPRNSSCTTARRLPTATSTSAPR